MIELLSLLAEGVLNEDIPTHIVGHHRSSTLCRLVEGVEAVLAGRDVLMLQVK